MFAEAIEDILRDQCTPAAVRAIEPAAPPRRCGESLARAGFLDLLRPEEERRRRPAAAGAVRGARALRAVCRAGAGWRKPSPRARWSRPAWRCRQGLLTLAPALLREADGSLHAPLVPFGAIAEHVLAADGDQLLLLSCAGAQRTAHRHRGSQAATLVWADDRGAERWPATPRRWRRWPPRLHAAPAGGRHGARVRHDAAVLQRARAVRQVARQVPGHPAPAERDGRTGGRRRHRRGGGLPGRRRACRACCPRHRQGPRQRGGAAASPTPPMRCTAPSA